LDLYGQLITEVWLYCVVEVSLGQPHFCKTLCYMLYFFASLLCFIKWLLKD